jgi:hypothetical protein
LAARICASLADLEQVDKSEHHQTNRETLHSELLPPAAAMTCNFNNFCEMITIFAHVMAGDPQR